MFRSWKNSFNGSEDDLVKAFISFYQKEELIFSNDQYIVGQYYEQIRIKSIGRVSDLIIKCTESRLINIEFKLGDYQCLLRQAKDHLKWADYSYVCVPINYLRIFPQSFCHELLEARIGLIVGSNDNFIEIFKAKHNTYKKGKSKEIRNLVLDKLRYRDNQNNTLFK